MYPVPTSLIPAFIALARCFESGGFSVFNQNYPFWYLGTTPFKYLVGPIAPILVSFVHKILNFVSLFDITIYLIIFSWLMGLIGWLLLYRHILFSADFEKKIVKYSSVLFVFLFLITPWKYLSGLAFGNATITLAQNFLPWVFLISWRYLLDRKKIWLVLGILSSAFLLLIDTGVLLDLVIGIGLLCLTASYKNFRFRKVGKKIKKGLTVLLGGFILATCWYGMGYWITLLGNPSIGGASGIKVIGRVLNLFKFAVPVALAFGVVYFNKSFKNRILIFSLSWLFTFTFLTLFRFIGDPDFWQDWTAWLGEVEIGIVFIVSTLLGIRVATKIPSPKRILVSLGLILIPLVSFWFAFQKLGQPALISTSYPVSLDSVKILSVLAKSDRVFMSGSTVFWSNAFFDIYQVRGGRDALAKDNSWGKGAYVLREGANITEMAKWLKGLEIKYVLVHTEKSADYYHDFKNIEVWDKLGRQVWEGNGDIVYRISTSK